MSKNTDIDKIWESVDSWFQPNNLALKRTINYTIQENYFSRADVQYAIRAIRQKLSQEVLVDWHSRVSKSPGETKSDSLNFGNILCLHAGNLPMVGFQDILAVLLSGHAYQGKISTKDPFLLPAFLEHLQDNGLMKEARWSTQLADLKNTKADAVLFSGSEKNLPEIRRKLEALGMVNKSTKYLNRTAHFSMAYIQDDYPKTFKDLTDAVFRYGGMGCRSVAVVVAPFGLNEIKCHFTDYIEAFWLENPQQTKPEPDLRYQMAYSKAIERPQAWLDHFLIQEGGLQPEKPFTLYWVEGGPGDVQAIAEEYRDILQNIYLTRSDINISGFEDRIDWLHNAQKPAINWKPDGINTLQWLMQL